MGSAVHGAFTESPQSHHCGTRPQASVGETIEDETRPAGERISIGMVFLASPFMTY
jgi:hypothetical protein